MSVKNMKKALIAALTVGTAFSLAACSSNDKPAEVIGEAPVIHGVEDKEILQGSKFIAFDGVSVTDKEDGEIDIKNVSVSGSVQTNDVGDYTLKYSVSDSHGNTTTEERVISVSLNDTSAPSLTGVANTTIELGDDFDILTGVQAIDNIDGDITSEIVTTGSVNVWAEGEYEVTYNVSDDAGNAANQVKRVITVVDNVDYNEAQTHGNLTDGQKTIDITSIVDEETMGFGMVKVTFETLVIGDSGTLSMDLPGATSVGSVTITESGTHTIYLKHISSLEGAGLTLSCDTTEMLVNNINVELGYKYKIAPTINLGSGYAGLVPFGLTEEAAKKFILDGVTATDDRDSAADVTYRLDVEFGDVNITTATGSQIVTITTYDNDGCEARLEVEIAIAEQTDNFLSDGTFDTSTEIDSVDPWAINNATDTVWIENNMMVHMSTKLPGWASDTSPRMIIDNVGDDKYFNKNNYYLIQFDIASELARNGAVRFGLSTSEAYGWIEDFTHVGGSKQFDIKGNNEFTTVSYLFYMHDDVSANGDTSLNLEINLGCFYWNETAEANNKTYIDNFVISEVSFPDTQGPVFSGLDDATVIQGDTSFNPIIGVSANDAVEGDVTDNIVYDKTTFDINTPGVYEVKFTATDSLGNESIGYRTITVLHKELPTMTGLQDQRVDFADGINLLEGVVATDFTGTLLTDAIEITVDGEIVDGNTYIFSAIGTYVVQYTVVGSTGLELTIEIEIEIYQLNEKTIEFNDYADDSAMKEQWYGSAGTEYSLTTGVDTKYVNLVLGSSKSEIYGYTGLFNTTNADESVTNNWQNATELVIKYKSNTSLFQITFACGNGPEDINDWKGYNVTESNDEWTTLTINLKEVLGDKPYDQIQQLMIVIPTGDDQWAPSSNVLGNYVQVESITLK